MSALGPTPIRGRETDLHPPKSAKKGPFEPGYGPRKENLKGKLSNLRPVAFSEGRRPSKKLYLEPYMLTTRETRAEL